MKYFFPFSNKYLFLQIVPIKLFPIKSEKFQQIKVKEEEKKINLYFTGHQKINFLQ